MNSSFLADIQTLHDSDWNWKEKGLTDVGVGIIRNICKTYELPFHKLKFNQS